MMKRPERALSETFSIVIIALLVVVAAILLIASMTGVITNLLQKPALFSVQTVQYNTSANAHIIGLFHQQGDPVNLNGTAQRSGTSIVSLSLIDRNGLSFTVSPDGPLQKDRWAPGDMLYIYSKDSGGSYVYSDAAPTSAISLNAGTYTIKITDDKVHILINALPITIR